MYFSLLTGPCVQQVHCSSCQSWSCSIQTEGWPVSSDNPKNKEDKGTVIIPWRLESYMSFLCVLALDFYADMFGWKKVHLHGTINLAAVKHEVEVVQVAQGRLPGHIFSLIVQVLGGTEGQHCRDYFCSLGLQDCKNEWEIYIWIIIYY